MMLIAKKNCGMLMIEAQVNIDGSRCCGDGVCIKLRLSKLKTQKFEKGMLLTELEFSMGS